MLGFAQSLLAFAPHPTVLSVEYNKQMLPVATVNGTDPVVIIDGQTKRITSEPAYLPQRAEKFGEGFIQLTGVSLGGSSLKIVASMEDANAMVSTGGPSMGATYFEATMQSKQELQGGFVVLVAYPPSAGAFFLPAKYNMTSIIVHDLPELPAGKPVKVKFSGGLIRGANLKYFVQIFDGSGREIMTNTVNNAWLYYSAMERTKLIGAIDTYKKKFSGADHAAVPIMMARAVIPDDLTKPETPGTVTMTISADGTVGDIEITGVTDDRLRQCFVEAMNGWLFLPRLKAGEPVASKVQIPLEF